MSIFIGRQGVSATVQSGYSAAGTVLDSLGAPLAGVTITASGGLSLTGIG